MVKFNVFEAVRHPTESDTWFIIEAIVSSQSGLTDPLEASLVHSDSEERGEEAEEYVKWMDSFEPNRRKYYEPLGENTQTLIPYLVGPLSRPDPFGRIRTESKMPCYHSITQNPIFAEVISKFGQAHKHLYLTKYIYHEDIQAFSK